MLCFSGCSNKLIQFSNTAIIPDSVAVFPTFSNNSIFFISKYGIPVHQKPLPATYTMSELIDPVSGIRSWIIHDYDAYLFKNNKAVIKQGRAIELFKFGNEYALISRDNFSVKRIYADLVSDFSLDLLPIKKTQFSLNPLEKKKQYWVYINTQGEELFNQKFAYAEKYSEGKARVFTNGEYYFINEKGEKQFAVNYEWVSRFSDSLAIVRKWGKWGAINHDGKVAIPLIFDELSVFSEGFAIYKKNLLSGYINTSGEVIIDAKYDKALPFSHGFGIVISDSVYSFINQYSQIEATGLQHALPFADSLSAAQINKKWGYINTRFEWVIPPIYERALSFRNGLGIIWKESFPWYINKSGKKVAPVFTKEELERFWNERREVDMWMLTKMRI